jgi:hypothetical protein
MSHDGGAAAAHPAAAQVKVAGGATSAVSVPSSCISSFSASFSASFFFTLACFSYYLFIYFQFYSILLQGQLLAPPLPELEASLVSQLVFAWLTPLVKRTCSHLALAACRD